MAPLFVGLLQLGQSQKQQNIHLEDTPDGFVCTIEAS